jgi:PAS domain S-box-containing protein
MPLEGLHKLSAAVNRAERLDQIYDAAIEALLGSLHADRISILLFDEAMVMRFVASHGLSDAYMRAVEGHSPWKPDSTDAEPILIGDVDIEESLTPLRDTIRDEGIKALAFIPLLYRSRLLGKFMVYFDEAHVFSEEERMLAQTIANHVSFAIEQKRTENNLTLYRNIFERSPIGIGVVDLAGRYIEQNPSHRMLVGYSESELKGMTPAIHLGEENFTLIRDALAGSDTFQAEMISTRKDGRKTPIELSAFVVRDSDGQPVCLVGMKNDITVRKEAEGRVLQINEELEQRVAVRTRELQRAKDEMEGFCYSVSHDLRAPLRGITGSAMMLLEDYPAALDEEGKHHLRRLAAASTRMAQLIDDLLQYSRLGRQEPQRVQVDLKAVAEKVAMDLLRRHVECGHLRLEVAEVPPVHADPQLMEFVLHNLLENACKFTGSRPEPRVEFGCDTSDGKRVFFVRDNGVGFYPQYAGKLFRPFERLHTESEYPGTGIGLANVKRIIERHGGAIWCDAQLGHGATFYFTLA